MEPGLAPNRDPESPAPAAGGPRAPRRRSRVVLYNVLIVVVLLGAAELTTRVVSLIGGDGFGLALHELDPGSRQIKDTYEWHPFTGFIFARGVRFLGSHPGQDYRVVLSADRFGFLAEDDGLEIEKPRDEIRIAAIGGSTTANVNLTYADNWPGALGRLLAKDFPGRRIRVINAGVPGFDTAQSIGNLALRVMPFSPDVVIIYHAYNDLKAIRPQLDFQPDYSHIHSTPYGFAPEPGFLIGMLERSMLYVRTRNRYRRYRQAAIVPGRAEEAAADGARRSSIPALAERTFEQHIRSLAAIARAGDATVVLSTFASLHDPGLDWSKPETLGSQSEFQRASLGGLLQFTPGLTLEGVLDGLNRYNEVLREVARDEGLRLVDNANLVPHEDRYFVDRVHFSREGGRRMAENLYPTVLRALRDRTVPSDGKRVSLTPLPEDTGHAR